jgi:hypothetical protein
MRFASKIIRLLQVPKEQRLRVILARILSLIPRWLFGYDHFYIVKCTNFLVDRATTNNDARVTITGFSPELLRNIKADLPDLDTETIEFQLAGRKLEDVNIISVNEDNRCVAVCFTVKVTDIKSPSGYRMNLGAENSVTWIFGTLVAEASRSKLYFLDLARAGLLLSRQNGSHGLCAEIHGMNTKSIRVNALLGFTVFRNLHYICILHWKYFWDGPKEFWCLRKRAGDARRQPHQVHSERVTAVRK